MPDSLATIADWIKEIVGWIAASAVGLLLWIGRREISRVDGHSDKIGELSAKIENLVTREEYAKNQQHSEEKMDKQFSSVHSRLDNLLNALLNNKKD